MEAAAVDGVLLEEHTKALTAHLLGVLCVCPFDCRTGESWPHVAHLVAALALNFSEAAAANVLAMLPPFFDLSGHARFMSSHSSSSLCVNSTRCYGSFAGSALPEDEEHAGAAAGCD
eukprot:scaffold46333_cov17-Tisochrysis_lutea.AAC.1